MHAFMTYKKSLIINICLHIGFLFATFLTVNTNSRTLAIRFIICLIFILWASYLLYYAPNSYTALSEGLKSSASIFGWVEIISGWFGLAAIGISFCLVIYVMAFVSQNADNSDLSFMAGAVAVIYLIVICMVAPLIVILIQNGRNILRAVESISLGQNCFQPGYDPSHSPHLPQGDAQHNYFPAPPGYAHQGNVPAPQYAPQYGQAQAV